MIPSPIARLGSLALLSLAGFASAQTPAPVDEAALISLLLSATEKATLESLTGAEREQYLADFWTARDPSPGTPENELRAVLMRRAERAALMFTDEPTPGWDTDRGRVLVVMGLPDEIERRTPTPGAPPPEIAWTYRRGSQPLRVLFTARDDGAYPLKDPVTLDAATFYASARLDMRLLVAAGVGAVEGIAPTQPGTPAPASAPTTATPSSAGGNSAPAASTAVPDIVAPEVAVWMQMIYAGVMRADLQLAARLDTMPAREGTYTVLSFEVEHEGLTFEIDAEAAKRKAPSTSGVATGAEPAAGETSPEGAVTEALEGTPPPTTTGEQAEQGTPPVAPDPDLAIRTLQQTGRPEMPVARLRLFGAYLQGEPGSEDTVHAFIIPFEVPLLESRLGEDPPAVPDPENLAALAAGVRSALRSAAVTLVPGTYRLAWGILDEATNAATTRDELVEIPDYTLQGLELTRPLLVRPPHQQAVRELTSDEVVRGVRMGNLVLETALDNTFGRDEIVEVVLMASGWASDAGQPGKPSLEVEYRIIDADGGRPLARLPAQSLDFAILGQQIPLGQVRALEAGGSYRIEVRVKDLVGGQEATVTAPLHIAAAAPAAQGQ